MSHITSTNKLGELSNIQIDNYLNNYPEWVGCYARDKINFKTLKANAFKYTMAGCMINLAPHNKPGTHWTLLVIRNRPQNQYDYYYFDPFGSPPPEEIVDTLEDVEYSDKEYQAYEDSDCGWFGMFIFLQMWMNKKADNPLVKAASKLKQNDPEHNKELMKAYFSKISVPHNE